MKAAKVIVFLIVFKLQFLNGRPLRILFYTHTFPEFVQPFILNQITGLIKRGHYVRILAASKKNYAERVSGSSTIPKELHPAIKKYNLLRKTYYQHLPKTNRNYDFILCQQGTFGTEFLKKYKMRNVKGKIITFFRGRDITARLKEDPQRYNKLFRYGTLFLPVCKYFKKLLVERGCNPRKIVVLHAAIDCEKFKFNARTLNENEPIKLITTGRFVEKKGIAYAIRAVEQLLKKYENIEFSIIGGGPLESVLKELTQDLGITSNVKFVGWKTQDEVINLLHQSHIFLLPAVTGEDNDKEGISNALKEAMATGLPVIATNHSGNPELIEDGVSGFLVPERDVDKLADRLEYLINHPELWPVMGKAGRKRIEKEYDMEKENEKLEKICKLLAENKTEFLQKLSW